MERVDYFYFVVDVSGSMRGRKIGSVNDAVNNIIHRLRRFVGNRSLTAKIITLAYADEPRWSNFIPVDVTSFAFSDLQPEGEASHLGKALEELDRKLFRQGDTDSNKGRSTTIIFFTDGLSTDDLQGSVDMLAKNEIFCNSNRIGVTFNDELSRAIAEENLRLLVNGSDNIIADDFVKLNRMLFEKYK